MKNELDREITKEFEGLRAKKYGYLTDDNDETKLKRTKKKETKIWRLQKSFRRISPWK